MAPRARKAAKRGPRSRAAPKPASKTQRPPPDYTSQAERKRRQPTCSMASLRELEDEVTIEANFIGLFGTSSDSHHTWGKTQAKPITAVKRRARKVPQLTAYDMKGFPKGFFSSLGQVDPEPIIPNCPDRSPFLRLPLEVRENIYAQTLIFKLPVILQHDWNIVENKTYKKKRNNSLVFVCKQINIEAISFLYKNNFFRTILRPPPNNFWHRETFSVPAKFLPLLKNVIITCEKENYHLEWFEKACISVRALSEANVNLDTLTIVTYPQEVGMSDTAVGMEANPITFADFFFSEGQFMTELKKLRFKFLNIIMKKIDLKDMDVEDNKWRVLISVDMRCLHPAAIEEGPLANEETIKLAHLRKEATKKELLGLKDRFEEVFEDDVKAGQEGKCVEMDERDPGFDGMALAAGYFWTLG